MTLTYLLFSIAPLAVAPPQTSPLLLGSDHLPILLTIFLSLVFRPKERFLSFNFPKTRWDDFAYYFESHCSSAEEYFFSFLCCCSLYFSVTVCPPYDLVLWTDGSFAFLFGKSGSGVLANCSLCNTEATLSFSAVPVCSSFSAEACAVLQAFYWSRQHQQVCRFSSLLLPSGSRSVLATLRHLFFYLSLCGRSGRNCLFSSCSIRLQWVAGHSFLPWNDEADELARREALLVPSTILCSLSPLISRIYSCLFSDWRRTVSSKFFDTQVPSISTEEPVLPRHARCTLSRLRCNGHSLLLNSYLSTIGKIENPSCSACGHPSQETSHLILHCPATDSAPLSLW